LNKKSPSKQVGQKSEELLEVDFELSLDDAVPSTSVTELSLLFEFCANLSSYSQNNFVLFHTILDESMMMNF